VSTPSVSPSETNPAAEGARIVELFAKSARGYVAACALVRQTLDRFPHGTPEFYQFAEVLIAARQLSESEAARGPKSGKLSKLCKIADYANVLLLPELLRCVEAGYTVAYQACLLHARLPGDDEDKTRALIEIVDAAPELTKDYLAQQTETAKAIEDRARNDRGDECVVKNDVFEQINRKSIDLILATPQSEIMREISQTLYDQSALFRCLRFHELVAKEAVVVVIAKVVDLPVIETKLFPCCGFKRFSHVFLVRKPASADIGGADVAVIGIRGDLHPILLTTDSWIDEASPLDPVGLALRLFPDAESPLHVFANERTEGWTSLLGDENWSERAVLK
jgi:hypothetical protein